MKKSVDILGLPVISITEGRELGMSKTLLIDAPNRVVAAITIEDEDWYRGVKLIPYDNVIAVGEDAVTINNSENILTLDAAGDFETLLDDNIRVIGTKAITRSGVIQGTISEIFIGEDGSIEKCEITTPEGMASEVTADQVSIFGKEVTVISPEGDAGKKSDAAAAPAAPAVTAPADPAPAAEPVIEETPAVEAAPVAAMPVIEESAPVAEAAPVVEPRWRRPRLSLLRQLLQRSRHRPPRRRCLSLSQPPRRWRILRWRWLRIRHRPNPLRLRQSPPRTRARSA